MFIFFKENGKIVQIVEKVCFVLNLKYWFYYNVLLTSDFMSICYTELKLYPLHFQLNNLTADRHYVFFKNCTLVSL